jgi:hypothetical protein
MSYKLSYAIYTTIAIFTLIHNQNDEEQIFTTAIYLSFLCIYMMLINHIRPHSAHLYKHIIDIYALLYHRENVLFIMMSYQLYELIWQYDKYNRPNPQVPF